MEFTPPQRSIWETLLEQQLMVSVLPPQNNIRGKTLKDVAFSQHFLKYWVPFFDCDQLKK
jgi:hypothetical protein